MDESSSPKRQQTIKLAIDSETGELIASEALLELPEAEFTGLRREAMAARLERRRGGTAMRFQCAVCRGPLYLSRHIRGWQNRWFAHDGPAEHCPWYEGNRLTPDQVKALVYRGQQEGLAHREAKQFIASWLAKDPSVSHISQEQTTFSATVNGEWRRPDVKCIYAGKPLVFEIQLSYTFLSDVIARDEFYKREGIFIIWVFASFDRNRAAVTDEAFFNRRNLFVLDGPAKLATTERLALTFSGHLQKPVLYDNQISDFWMSHPVGLHEVTFPIESRRPYFFDYDAERKRLETERIDAWFNLRKQEWRNGIENYLAAATLYLENDYVSGGDTQILSTVERLSENSSWHSGFESLRSARFYSHRCVLAVLLSIKRGQTMGYSRRFNVYQVMEAGLRSGSEVGQHAFAILFLWAYKTYRPAVSEKHRKWLRDYGREVKRSVDAGEPTYRRDTVYDEAIGTLFPELEEQLATAFGTL